MQTLLQATQECTSKEPLKVKDIKIREEAAAQAWATRKTIKARPPAERRAAQPDTTHRLCKRLSYFCLTLCLATICQHLPGSG